MTLPHPALKPRRRPLEPAALLEDRKINSTLVSRSGTKQQAALASEQGQLTPSHPAGLELRTRRALLPPRLAPARNRNPPHFRFMLLMQPQ